MSRLKTPTAVKAWEEVMQYAPGQVDDWDVVGFQKAVDALVWEVQDETELALMHGHTRHLGMKHMLLSSVYTALSMSLRPVQREASFEEFKRALSIYLGIKLKRRSGKRRRRKLLRPH